MRFEDFSGRILSFKDRKVAKKQMLKKFIMTKWQVVHCQMNMTTIQTSLFALLSDKTFVFSEGIFSLAIGHPSLRKFRES